MIPKYAPADLGLLSIAPQSGIVKNTKFDHVLDTIFCAFWTEFVHGALANISVLTNLSEWLILKWETLLLGALPSVLVNMEKAYLLLPDSGLLHMSGKIPIHANQIQMRLRLNGHFLMPYGLVLPHFYVRGLIFSQSKQSLQAMIKDIFFRNNGCVSLVN